MKKPKTLLIAFCLCCLGTAIVQAQTFDRVAISSGGISSDTVNVTLGEIFVFTASAGGMSLDAGAQSGTDNTGGLVTTVTNAKNPQTEILVYPNPVADYLNLQINGLKSATVSFQIYDTGGKLTMQQNSAGSNDLYRLQVSQLPQGNYFIQGFTAQGETFGKIQFIKL
ncbi:MAG: T9SS type A sorting domain-containing protein [Bacteroidales bacterium]|nr:T9SS type A sorting domain-containing protein [Bacteroidales bacterium]